MKDKTKENVSGISTLPTNDKEAKTSANKRNAPKDSDDKQKKNENGPVTVLLIIAFVCVAGAGYYFGCMKEEQRAVSHPPLDSTKYSGLNNTAALDTEIGSYQGPSMD